MRLHVLVPASLVVGVSTFLAGCTQEIPEDSSVDSAEQGYSAFPASCPYLGGVYETTADCRMDNALDLLRPVNDGLVGQGQGLIPADNYHYGVLTTKQVHNKVIVQQASLQNPDRKAPSCSYVSFDHTDDGGYHPLHNIGVRGSVVPKGTPLQIGGKVVPLVDDPASLRAAWQTVYDADFQSKLLPSLPTPFGSTEIQGSRYTTFDAKGTLLAVQGSYQNGYPQGAREKRMWVIRKEGTDLVVEAHAKVENRFQSGWSNSRCRLRLVTDKPRFDVPQSHLPAVVVDGGSAIYDRNGNAVDSRMKDVLLGGQIVTVIDPAEVNLPPAPAGYVWAQRNDVAISINDIEADLAVIRQGKPTSLEKHRAIGLVPLRGLTWPFRP